MYKKLRAAPGATPKSALEEWRILCPGIPSNTMLAWCRKEAEVREAATHISPKVRRSCLSESALDNRQVAQFPAQETAVYDAFVIQRNEGLPVSGLWLKGEMRCALAETRPAKWQQFKYSNGWVTRWLSRFHVSHRTATNCAPLTAAERAAACLKYFCYVQQLSAAGLPGVPWDANYGSFPSHRRFNIDQVPLEFACAGLLRTYEIRGKKVVHVKEPKHKVEIRECSLLLTFNAVCEVPVASICLRGMQREDENGVRNPRLPWQRQMQQQFAELRTEFPSVHLYVQKNGYFDSAVLMAWAEDFIADLGQGPHIVTLDNLNAHCTPEFRELLLSAGVHLVYLPPRCTDLVQVVDAGLGYAVKRRMKNSFFSHYLDNHRRWNDGKVSAAQRRRLHVTWLSTALANFYEEDGMKQVKRIFRRCGLNNRLDGRDDAERVIPGYDEPIVVPSFLDTGRCGADDLQQSSEIPTHTQRKQVFTLSFFLIDFFIFL